MNFALGDGIQVGAPADLVLLDTGPGSLSIKEVNKKGIFGILQESLGVYRILRVG
jgi:hypothetical protein